jgi:DNA-3-methyladenine glycosylase II
MKYLKVLKSDKILETIIFKPIAIKKQSNDLYLHFLKAIIGQQLSTKAANTIWIRFENLFDDKYPKAEIILALDTEIIRSTGISYQKVNYLKNIAEFQILNNFNSKGFKRMKTESLINLLTQIKGVGKWTVEMVLMFAMNKKDVFPIDDLGIINAMKMLYSLPENKKELKIKMSEIAENWRPYRSYACFYLWQYKDNYKSELAKN